MLKSDNNSGVNKRLIEFLGEINIGDEDPYGADKYTKYARELISELFGKDVETFFTTSGTSANVLALSSMLRPYEGVICPDTGHINTDEVGAFERFTGSKLLPYKNENGKIGIEAIKKYLGQKNSIHNTHPKVLSISQLTETGTLYTVEEIRTLVDYAHKNNILVHVDGARISNAIVALGSSFKEMITDTNVDILSFGGTKNGLMVSDAVVILNKDLVEPVKYQQKQAMELTSKMRFISGQFIPYIKENMWYENAKHANDMAQYFMESLKDSSLIDFDEQLEANMIFAKVDKEIIDKLMDKHGFNIIDKDSNYVRIITSFNTKKEDLDLFIKDINALENK